MHLTPEILEKAYELLRATAPFKRWKLPHADEVEFHVCEMKAMAQYWLTARYGKPSHKIAVCCKGNRDVQTVNESMMHEMVHLHQRLHIDARNGRWSAPHGRVFKRLAAQVCRAHRLDPAKF